MKFFVILFSLIIFSCIFASIPNSFASVSIFHSLEDGEEELTDGEELVGREGRFDEEELAEKEELIEEEGRSDSEELVENEERAEQEELTDEEDLAEQEELTDEEDEQEELTDEEDLAEQEELTDEEDLDKGSIDDEFVYERSDSNPIEGSIRLENYSFTVISFKCWDADGNRTEGWKTVPYFGVQTCKGKYMRVDFQCAGCRRKVRTYADGCKPGYEPLVTAEGSIFSQENY